MPPATVKPDESRRPLSGHWLLRLSRSARSNVVRQRLSKPVLLFMLVVYAGAASSGSIAPGTSIDNQASASYMAASGSSTTASSNVVHVITQAGAAVLTLTKS